MYMCINIYIHATTYSGQTPLKNIMQDILYRFAREVVGQVYTLCLNSMLYGVISSLFWSYTVIILASCTLFNF